MPGGVGGAPEQSGPLSRYILFVAFFDLLRVKIEFKLAM